MPTNFIPTGVDYARIAPELILTLVGTLIMFLEAVMKGDRKVLGYLSAAALVAGIFAALSTSLGPAFPATPGTGEPSMMLVDGTATFFKILVMAAGLLVLIGSSDYLQREGHETGEYYALVLFSIVGQCIMVSANELIMIFIGLEIAAIASYILAGYLRDDSRNNAAALQYFLLG